MYNKGVKRKGERPMKYVIYYDLEEGRFYTKEELEAKFGYMKSWEITMRFMPCVRYKSKNGVDIPHNV